MDRTPHTTPDARPALEAAASGPSTGTVAMDERIRDILCTPCCCHACEPFYALRTLPPDPAFADLPISGREAFDRQNEKARRDLKASAEAIRHRPRVMDLPADIDMATLPGRLAYDGFHPSCPQYRGLVALLTDDSLESAIAHSRIGHFDRREAGGARKRTRPKVATKLRRVKIVNSLFAPEDLVIPQEQIEADRAHRARMAEPDRVGEALSAAHQRVSDQIAAAMLGTGTPEGEPSDGSGH